jgi:hypothetical protein
MRAGRVRGDRVPSPDGSTASGSVVGIARTQTTALVSKKIFVGTCISATILMLSQIHQKLVP